MNKMLYLYKTLLSIPLAAALTLWLIGCQEVMPQMEPVPSSEEPTPVPSSEERGLGLEWLDSDAYRNAAVMRADPVATLPPSVDLSDDTPPPGNQRNQGSCVGWAVAYALKTYHERVERGWSLTDQARVMSPAYVYNKIRLPGGGARFLDAFNLLIAEGVSSWKQMPYNPLDHKTKPGAAARAEAANYRIAAWGAVYRGTNNASFVEELKRHLVAGRPAVIGVPVYPDFDALSESNPIYDDASGKIRGRHALMIVGYDDTRVAFRFINSWGEDWGIDGYGWIAYAASESLIREAYITYDVVASPTDSRPAAATGPRPGDAATEVARDTALSWTRGERTTSFDVYVGTERELSAVDYQGAAPESTFDPGNLAPGTRYYWRVDARGAGGITRGPVWSFTTAGRRVPPAKATNPRPEHNAREVGRDATLSWQSGGRTTSYDVYFGTNAGELQLQGNQAGRTFDPGTLTADTTYSWRIDTRNGVDTTTGEVWSFTTETETVPEPQPDNKPDVSSVSAGSADEGDSITFSVSLQSATERTETYRYATYYGAPATAERGDYADETSGTATVSSGRSSFQIGVRTYEDADYDDETFFIYVRRELSDISGSVPGPSKYRATGTIRDDDTACTAFPTALSSPSPSDGARNVSRDADLSWSGGDSQCELAVTYDVYFGTDPSPDDGEKVATDISSKSWTLSRLNADTRYYWKIVARDSNGTRTSSTWDFRTEAAGCTRDPDDPSSPSPSHRATSVSLDADLSWSGGDSRCGLSVTYRVYFGTDSTPDSGEYQGQTSSKSWSLSQLQVNTTYYWRIDARDSNGTERGPTWRFRTGYPDLDVSSFSATPRSLNVGQTYTLSVRVRNGGSVSSPATTLKWYWFTHTSTSNVDWSTPVTQLGSTVTVGSLSSGASRTYTHRQRANNYGRQFLGVCVTKVAGDPDDADCLVTYRDAT